MSIKPFSEVCWVGHRNTCCTSRGRYSKLLFLCWTNCKRATDSHRWKQTLESISLRCRLWCFSVKPWLSSYLFGMYLFPPKGKGRDTSGDSRCCRGIKLWHLILVGALVWAWKMSSKCDWTVTLWIIASNLSRDFGLLYLVFSRGHGERATRFRYRLKTLAVVSRRQLKPLPLPQRLLFHDSAIGEKPFVEATSTWVVHDELTFCQMDCGVLTEWSTVRRQRRRHQQLRHQWATKQRGECCWTCSINEIMYLASWRFSGQRILFFIR